jgi:hypothetical protein
VIVRLTKAANGNGSVPEELPPAIHETWISIVLSMKIGMLAVAMAGNGNRNQHL